MESILDAINEWIKEILIGAINGNLSTMFGDVNEKVGTIAAEVGKTPQGWNANIFSMIQNLSENVIVPIAGLVITYVLCYELISMVKDTRQHNTWRFYGEQTRDTILAYAVELTGTEQGKIKGNLYELDYLQHFREVIEKSIPADNYTLIYEHGELTKPAGQYFDGDTDPQLGKFIRFEAQPNDPEALKSLLREQQKKRTPHTQRDFQLHIAALHDRRIEAEARRIVENVKGLGEPDSPEKTHCAVELSPYFVPLATDKDMERLLSMLPYKSLSLSTLEGRHGVYALIDKSERNKEMKQSPPSVRAQLQTEKSQKVPKKTAKTKHHELEV